MTETVTEAMIEAGCNAYLASKKNDDVPATFTAIYLAMSRASQPVDATDVESAASTLYEPANSLNALDSEAVERVRAFLANYPINPSDNSAVAVAHNSDDYFTFADLRALLSLAKPVGGGSHLFIGGKTRCGHWLNPDMKTTVSVADVGCHACRDAYAALTAMKGNEDA